MAIKLLRGNGSWLFVGAMLLGVSAGVAKAQAIQKWRTPDGKLYFGERPPQGSTKIGQEGSNEPPPSGNSAETAVATPRSAEQEKLSIDTSRSRTQIEKALNLNADHLEDIERKIDEVERQPDFVEPWMERRAGIKNEKVETLRGLEAKKRETLKTMVDLWNRFDELDAKVKKAHDGTAPDWWRSALSCLKCPSRNEAENALK